MPPQESANNNATSAFDYRSLLPSAYQPLNSSKPPVPDSAVYNNGISDGQNSSNNDDDDWCACCSELSFRERMLGFGTCLIAGYMLSFGSFWRIRDLILGNPYPLVLHTTIGNLLAWAGSFFLVGPKQQWKRLWEDNRKLATQVYVASLVLSLVIILTHPPGPEGLYLFVLIVVQNGAMAWYCLSYIPFAHATIQSWVGRVVSERSSDLSLSSYMPAPV